MSCDFRKENDSEFISFPNWKTNIYKGTGWDGR